MAALSKPQAFRLDAIVEEARAAGGGLRRRRTVAEQATAAARAAHLRRRRAGRLSAYDQIVDRLGRHSGRKPFAVLPFPGDLAAHLVPVATHERPAHGDRRVAD